MENRKVTIYEFNEKRTVSTGIFLGFGIGYRERGVGPGMFSTAIIEMPSGEVKNVPVENIVFNN